MEETLTGNILVAQSGGPSAVINASLAGVITEALNHECIEEIYGGLNGVEGILNEQLIDLAAESQQTVRGLCTTPASALGTCRYKLKSERDFARIIDVFKAHNIRYFFYIGGNDSQDTANKIAECAKSSGYELRVIGIPKTIDNDLPVTDHCPGYGSVVKYLCTSIRELALDHESMGNHDLVSIVEVMGRNAGWIAAGTSVAKRRNQPEDAPHIILLPEVAFNADYFLSQVQECLKKNKFCLVVASEGIIDANGNYVAAADAQLEHGIVLMQQLGNFAQRFAGHDEAQLLLADGVFLPDREAVAVDADEADLPAADLKERNTHIVGFGGRYDDRHAVCISAVVADGNNTGRSRAAGGNHAVFVDGYIGEIRAFHRFHSVRITFI